MIHRPLGSSVADANPSPFDRYFAFFNYLLIGANVVAVAVGNVQRWHEVQSMGTIAFLPFLGTRWWVHARWITETLVDLWSNYGLMHGRYWAMVVTALMSASYLYSPLHTGHWFYIVDNLVTLTYPLLRLFGVLGAKPRDRYVGEPDK